MPELPEVEKVRANVQRHCRGRSILSVKVIDEGVLEGCSARGLASLCKGRSMTEVERHGKQMFIVLDRGGVVTVHLGMTGDIIFSERRERPGRHDRVLFDFADGSRLIYQDMRKFGAIGIAASIEQFVKAKRLGPDALEVGGQEFIERICGHDRAIKTVLLDQKVIAGLGNLYADEVLFQSRVHPLRLARGLSKEEAGAIFRNTRKVLLASLRASSDFELLPKGFLLRVRAPGARCPRRDCRLASLRINGRTSFFCPSCQPI